MAVFDWDDHHPANDAMPWMHELKAIRPDFKATLFAVPGLGLPDYWRSLPDWIELAVHGWFHPDPYECAEWTYERMQTVIDAKPRGFVNGWKSPGWQTSDAVYQCLLDNGWWCADQHLEDGRRPVSLATYFYEDGPDRHHGHVQDVCGNGLRETWNEVRAKVEAATEFLFCSEALTVGA